LVGVPYAHGVTGRLSITVAQVQPCWLCWHCGRKCCEWCRWWYLRVPFLCLFHYFLGHSGTPLSLEYLPLARVIMLSLPIFLRIEWLDIYCPVRCNVVWFEICTHLGYYPAYSGNSLPTFQDNLLSPSSRVKQFKIPEDGTDWPL
jgi:hypothetical protein